MQSDFNLEKACDHTRKLVVHMNKIFKHFYRDKWPTVHEHMPIQSMYRCHMLSRCILIFELFALVDPEKIRVDPFELLKNRGGFIFQAFCGPTGFLADLDHTFVMSHIRKFTKKSKQRWL